MVNLLPRPAQRTLVRTYYLRLGTLFLLSVSLVVAVGGVLVAPSVFLAQNAADASERYLAALEETVGLKERAGAGEQMAVIAERVKILSTVAPALSTPIIEDVIRAKPKGVKLNAFTIDRTASGANFSIAGVAVSRDALLTFVDALRATPSLSGVSLPVSSLASNEDLRFSLSLQYKNPAP